MTRKDNDIHYPPGGVFFLAHLQSGRLNCNLADDTLLIERDPDRRQFTDSELKRIGNELPVPPVRALEVSECTVGLIEKMLDRAPVWKSRLSDLDIHIDVIPEEKIELN